MDIDTPKRGDCVGGGDCGMVVGGRGTDWKKDSTERETVGSDLDERFPRPQVIGIENENKKGTTTKMEDIGLMDDIRVMHRSIVLRRRAARKRQATIVVGMGLVAAIPVVLMLVHSFSK